MARVMAESAFSRSYLILMRTKSLLDVNTETG